MAQSDAPGPAISPEELSDQFPDDDDCWEDDYDPGDECGRWDNGRLGKLCRLAGTEFCDWECPYGD